LCFLEWQFADRNGTVTQTPHNYVALGIYLVEFTFWAGIFACGGYYRFFPWLLSKSSLLWRLRQRTEFVFGHSRGHDHGGAADDSSEHRGDDVEMPARSSEAVRDLETVVDTAGPGITTISAAIELAGMADDSRKGAGREVPEGVEDEPITLSVFRTASSATTDTTGSRRRRHGITRVSAEMDGEVV